MSRDKKGKMKFYVYISDTKVDMLYAQIPSSVRDKVATELKIDLKILSTTFKEASTEATRFSKLKVVTEYILKHQEVGTVDAPAFFFECILPIHWGKLFDTEAVYFGGITDHTILGLIGSGKHIIGEAGTVDTGLIGSSAPFLMGLTLMVADASSLTKLKNDDANGEERKKRLQTLAERQGLKADEDRINQLLLSTVKSITMDMKGPVQKMEILAKRLAEGYDRQTDSTNQKAKKLLLGSPIYVALAE
jgi:hypothetical protein